MIFVTRHLPSPVCKSVKNSIYGTLGIAIRKTSFSNGSHLQWFAASDNDGISMFRTQPEKTVFSD